jgi:hypothetical protein
MHAPGVVFKIKLAFVFLKKNLNNSDFRKFRGITATRSGPLTGGRLRFLALRPPLSDLDPRLHDNALFLMEKSLSLWRSTKQLWLPPQVHMIRLRTALVSDIALACVKQNTQQPGVFGGRGRGGGIWRPL